MLLTDFIYNVEREKIKKPILFELLSKHLVKQSDIEIAEMALGISIPNDYKEFVLHYCGGMIGFVRIYTLEELLMENKDINTSHFLAISDNGCGDTFGYYIKENETTIYQYEHDEKKLTPQYDNLFSFICKVGFNA